MRTALDMALGVDGVGPPPAAGGVAISREALHRGVLEPPKPAESEVCASAGVRRPSSLGCVLDLLARRGV